MKNIWFKPDCIDWIRMGKKTTTWRTKKHDGEYVVVKGSWFKSIPIEPKLIVRLSEPRQISIDELVRKYWILESPLNKQKFKDWLIKNKLYQPEKIGWIHRIEIMK